MTDRNPVVLFLAAYAVALTLLLLLGCGGPNPDAPDWNSESDAGAVEVAASESVPAGATTAVAPDAGTDVSTRRGTPFCDFLPDASNPPHCREVWP